MITEEIKNQLKDYFKNLKKPVEIQYSTKDHDKKAELVKMLEDTVAISPILSLREVDTDDLRSGVSFKIVNGAQGQVIFSGIPGGHEFNSYILALLHMGGHDIKLDDSIKELIQSIDQPLKFQTYVSLSCHNCPDIVQLLNQFSALNPKIENEMIDGGVLPSLIEENSIQGVPTVFLNGKPFLTGKVEPAAVMEKLLKLDDIKKSAKEPVSEDSLKSYDVSIIGSGPAGVSAAIYAARKGLNVLLIGDRIGGQVRDTMDIENLISNIKTTGPTLSSDLESHLQEYENIIIRKLIKVTQIIPGQPHTLQLETGEKIKSTTIILTTGAKWKELNVPGEKEYLGKGVAYCPHCDGPFFKGKDVAVIGGGNSGVEAALDLSGIVKTVTVLEYANELNADQVLLDKLQSLKNISVITGAQTTSITAKDDAVKSLEYKERSSGEERSVDLSGVFVQIGLIPNSEFVKDLVTMTKYGEIIVDDHCQTNIPGIFAAGDVTTTPFKQIVIALGEGAKAALSAFNHIILKSAA
jgi:NADH-dependent peroxiredoxin subunit F